MGHREILWALLSKKALGLGKIPSFSSTERSWNLEKLRALPSMYTLGLEKIRCSLFRINLETWKNSGLPLTERSWELEKFQTLLSLYRPSYLAKSKLSSLKSHKQIIENWKSSAKITYVLNVVAIVIVKRNWGRFFSARHSCRFGGPFNLPTQV